MSSSLRDTMIKYAIERRSVGNWKRILYALLYGAEMNDIRRMFNRKTVK